MGKISESNRTNLLTKTVHKPSVSSSSSRFVRRCILLHKRLGTIVIALPIVWYALSGSLMTIARDFKLDKLYRFLQNWHSFQTVNGFTYQFINGLVACSILVLFLTGIVFWQNTRKGNSNKLRQKMPSRYYHRIVSQLFGLIAVIFAISGWTNALLSNYAPNSVYQLSRAIHNGSWLNVIWLHCCYGIVSGLALTVLTITGLLSAKRRKTNSS